MNLPIGLYSGYDYDFICHAIYSKQVNSKWNGNMAYCCYQCYKHVLHINSLSV